MTCERAFYHRDGIPRLPFRRSLTALKSEGVVTFTFDFGEQGSLDEGLLFLDITILNARKTHWHKSNCRMPRIKFLKLKTPVDRDSIRLVIDAT